MRSEQRKPTPHLGAQLHARNRYRDAPPDFYALAMRYPSFRQYVRNVNDAKHTASLAWDDPLAVRELTATLLLHDFQLQWTMPLNRLCPPVRGCCSSALDCVLHGANLLTLAVTYASLYEQLPNRLNYLHWIEDLLQQVRADPFTATAAPPPASVASAPIRGIDIGTGASCIYPLLGARLNNWAFIATEIDAASYASAEANVERNALERQITLCRTTTDRLLLEPLTVLGLELDAPLGPPPTAKGSAAPATPPQPLFHFSMCNPPFFDDMREADTNPQTCCMGSASEMVYPGGEVAFITHMIHDSLRLRTRVLWYTSLIGRKATIRKVLGVLRDSGVPHTRTTEFFQGRTKRWGIAWTFVSDAVLDSAAAASYKVLGKRKEAHRRNELVFVVPRATTASGDDASGCASLQQVAARVREFANTNKTIAVDGGETGREDDEGDDQGDEPEIDNDTSEHDYAFLRLRSAASPNSAFQGRIEVASDAESPELGFRVTIAYEAGDRSAFWRAADALKAATVRSGRQWRRRKQQQRQVDEHRADGHSDAQPQRDVSRCIS